MSEQQQFVLQDYAQGEFDPTILSCQAGEIPTPAEEQVLVKPVGGEMLDTIIGQHMALNSTVVLCGAISQYGNATDPDKQYHFKNILSIGYKRIRLEGFVILDYADRYDEIYKQLGEWNAEGKLIPRSHILDGLEQAPKALQMVLQGKNHGKMMVKVAQG